MTKKLNKTPFEVKDVSFSITEGDIFCLLGDKGAGKSAILKMLAGVTEMDSGEVTYYGEDLLGNLEEIHKKIGICLQNDIIFEKLTLRENLEALADIRNIPFFDIPQVVDEALRFLNLGPESRIFAGDLLFNPLEGGRKIAIFP